ncbi:MAG: hypothetical protein U1F36_05865 [Planctomycetota bacterium]
MLSGVRIAIAALGALVACSTPNPPAPTGSTDQPLAARAVSHPLPAGITLRLRPTHIDGDGDRFDGEFVDALLRESLRQTARFYVVADLEDGPADYELIPQIDAAAGQLAMALLGKGEDAAPLPLCAVPIRSGAIGDAVDATIAAVREAIGDASDGPGPSSTSLYSKSSDCVASTERALAALARGRTIGVQDQVDRARRADPGSPLTWLATATLELALGKTEDAERTARQALELLSARLGPTTRHRLARLLLLARAQGADAVRAAGFDRQLLELAKTTIEERPFDLHARYSRAVALVDLGDFAAALPDLEALAQRWPKVPFVGYYHAFALLGAHRPADALRALDDGARGLPEEALLLPRALALFGSGNTAELDEILVRLGTRDPEDSTWHHDVLRMRAALAILDGRRSDAVRLLLEDLQWLHARPSMLASRIDDLVDAGESLVRLGAARELQPRIDAFQALPIRQRAMGSVMAYLSGLVALALGDVDSGDLAIRSLESTQQDVEAARLRAARARRTGLIDDEARELARSIQLADATLDRADLAHVLDALGRRDDAKTLRDANAQRMFAIRVRGAMLHPLLSPSRALAFVAAR